MEAIAKGASDAGNLKEEAEKEEKQKAFMQEKLSWEQMNNITIGQYLCGKKFKVNLQEQAR